MPINRYQIRNVYRLADPELYKAADKDDPEALLEGVSMAGLVGVLRQLGDLAEFAAEIFRDLHDEVMATVARGHGLLVRVQQLESEIPPIERACLSQTCHSAFFPNSGIDWHPNRQATQNLITVGDLPRFVMDSYEECRGPPRLFLLDKFDVGGAGACLKRYTDPSIFKVEASSIEIAETQREKKIRQTKKKGPRGKEGETLEVSQPSHAKLHQLFLEERVQTGATEPARHVKLKIRPNKLPFDSKSGELYMNKLLNSPSHAHEVTPIPFNGSRHEDSSIMELALGSPVKITSPCASSRKVAESRPSNAEVEVDDNQIAVDDEICTDRLQNSYPLEDVSSETDNYMDALGTMESEVETSITQGTYSDTNKHQLQSHLSDSQSTENYNDGINSITKEITVFGNSDTTSTSTEHTSPVGADSPPQPFACIEIPFHPRVPPVADDVSVTQNPCHDITNDTCIDTSKVTNVDHVASMVEGTSDSNEVFSDHTEKLDSPKKSEEPQMDKQDDMLETSKNLGEYDEESHSTDLLVGSSQSVISCTNELSSDTTFNNDIPVTEDIHEKQFKEKVVNVLVISDQAEARVSYFSGYEKESANAEIEPVTIADANTNECIDSVLKEGTESKSEEREIESTYSDDYRDDGKVLGDDTKLEQIEADYVYSDIGTRAVVLLVDVDKHEDISQSISEQYSKESGEQEEVNELLVISPDDVDNNDDSPSLSSKILQNQLAETDQNQEVIIPDLGSQPVDIGPCVSNVQLADSVHEASAFTELDNDREPKSPNHIDILEAAQSSPSEDNVDQSNIQLHLQLPLETEGSQLKSPTQVDHETHVDTHLQDLKFCSEKPPTMESSNHGINTSDQVKHQSSPVKQEDLPPLPPLPPMQWRMKKLQNALSTSTNGDQHNDIYLPPIFPSTSTEISQAVGHSTIDENINLDMENQDTEHDSQMLLPDSKNNEVKIAETLVPQAAVEMHPMPTIYHQEVFWPSSIPYLLPPVFDEMPSNIQPMKVQRPRSPLIDAVAAHDKTKLRKVSDRDTTQIPKGEERETLLNQIRAKSLNLKPAVQARPIVQGPNTNLRVAAILEKANAIRQAFAGSDDDDDSETWSD
ncbi:hypothetical protein R6Q57_009596 [Mikania cordata]